MSRRDAAVGSLLAVVLRPRPSGWTFGLMALVATVVCVAAVLTPVPTPLQAICVGVFFLVAPGLAIVGCLPPLPAGARLPAVVALSISVDMIVSLLLFYTHTWGPHAVLASLAAVVTAGSLLSLRQPHRPQEGEL